MQVDPEHYPTIARLLPMHRDVIEIALLTTLAEWPDNIVVDLVEAVPDDEVRRALFRELIAHANDWLKSPDPAIRREVGAYSLAKEVERRIAELEARAVQTYRQPKAVQVASNSKKKMAPPSGGR